MPKTLLLADDSVTIQKVVGISFANEDIVLLTVDNGDDAVVRASEARPDIVLADVVMPGRSGYEVCEAIKNDPNLAGTPVLLLTGTFEAFDEDRAQRAGADGHITKPFEAQALVDQVNALLAQAGTAAGSPPVAADPVVAAQTVSPSADTAYDFFDDEVTEPGREDEPAAHATLLGEPSPAFGPRSDEAFGFEEPGGELGEPAHVEALAARPPEEVSAARLFDEPSANEPLPEIPEPGSGEEFAPGFHAETRIMSDDSGIPPADSFGSLEPELSPADAIAPSVEEASPPEAVTVFEALDSSEEPLEAHTIVTPLDADSFAAEPIEPASDSFAAPEQAATSDPFAAPAQPEASDPFAAPAQPGAPDPFAAPAQPEASDPFAAPAQPEASDPFAAPAQPEASDPFAAPAQPEASDPFAAPAQPEAPDPFAAPAQPEAPDPFAAPAQPEAPDPFAAPAQPEAPDPFAAPAQPEAPDPFAAPAQPEAPDPFAAPAQPEAPDPFAAPAQPEAPDPFAAPAEEPAADAGAFDGFAPPSRSDASDAFDAFAPTAAEDGAFAPAAADDASDAFDAFAPTAAEDASSAFASPTEVAAPDPFAPSESNDGSDAQADIGDPLGSPFGLAGQDESDPLAASPAPDTQDPLVASAALDTEDVLAANPAFDTEDPLVASAALDTEDPIAASPALDTEDPLAASPVLETQDPLGGSMGAPPPRSEWDGALDDSGDGTVAFEFGGPLADLEPAEAMGDAVLDPTSGGDYDVSSSDLGSPLAPASVPLAASEPEPQHELAPPSAAPDVSPLVRQEVRDAIEKIAWEAFGQITETLVKDALERIEKIAWEVVPQMTEALIREEIRKLKGGDPADE